MSNAIQTTALRRFADLTKEKRELEARVRGISKELADIKEKALEEMAESGLTSAPFEDMIVYASHEVRAKVADRDAACLALQRAGFEDLIQTTVNLNTLHALIREMHKEGEELPEEFAGVIEKVEFYDLRARAR